MSELFTATGEQLQELVTRISASLGGRHAQTVDALQDRVRDILAFPEGREVRYALLTTLQALEVVEPQVFVVARLWAKEVRHA